MRDRSAASIVRVLAAMVVGSALLPVAAIRAGEPERLPPSVLQGGRVSPTGVQEGGVQLKGAPQSLRGGVLGEAAPGQRMVAPTENLTQVANAFSLRHKSLTTLVTLPPNLPVTQWVEISIGFYSPAGTQRITQNYVRESGNRFLYDDPEGDGQARQMRVDISLREPKVGGYHTFSFPTQVALEPLYDVAIGPLMFGLLGDCDIAGESEIQLLWFPPGGELKKRTVFTRQGQEVNVDAFAWSGSEIGPSREIGKEAFVGFVEHDHPIVEAMRGGFWGMGGGARPNLVPGTTQKVNGNRKALEGGSCEAYFEYTTTYTLRHYPQL